MEHVYEIPVLMQAASRMRTASKDVLNLVRPDWKQVLENHPIFQKFQHHASEMYSPFKKEKTDTDYINSEYHLEMVLLGKWSLYTDPGKRFDLMIAKECEPLVELQKAMLSDKDTNYKLQDAAFYIDQCGPAFCSNCYKTALKFNKNPFSKEREWCVARTRVFNGESITNVFKNSIVGNFQNQPTYGILHVQLKSRTHFKNKMNEDCIQIKGSVVRMILFKEQCILPIDDFDLDSVEPPMDSRPIPPMCNPVEESTLGHEELDFLGSIPIALTKRTDSPPLKKAKLEHSDSVPFECVPESIDIESEKGTNSNVLVTSKAFRM